MHPSKFLGRSRQPARPVMSESEREERLAALGSVIAGKRRESVEARKNSGIESVWLACEEAYLGIDDMNRAEFSAAKWAKPTTMSGGLTSNVSRASGARSTAFVRLTSRYVDVATAKLGEIILPIDDKAFSFDPTPEPDLVKSQDDIGAMIAGAPVQSVPQVGMPPAVAGPQDPSAPAATPVDVAAQEMDRAKASAKRAETRIYDWMVESKYPAETRKVAHDSARIGCGVLKGPFPDVQSSRAASRVNGGIALQIKRKIAPAMKWIDPWNLFPDGACGEDIHSGDGIFERDFLSSKMLKKLIGQDGYLKAQIEQVIEEGPGKIFTEGGNPVDSKKSIGRYEIWYYYGLIKRSDMLLADAVGMEDLPDDQDEVHAIISIVNDTVIRAIINPLDSGVFPYRVMSWSRRPGHWAGVGVGEQMSMPQRMCNASTRALLNNAGLSSGVQLIINQLGIIPADGSYELTPNKVWYATGDVVDVRAAFQAILVPSVQPQMMAIIEYAMKLAEESTGIPLITQGQTGPTSPNTFGQAELQDNNSHTWLRSVGYRFDDQITEPLVNDLYEWLLLDPNVPDDEKGDFRINAHGSIAMVERAIQEQVLLGLLQASANPAFQVDPAKLFGEYLKSKRLDPRQIQYSAEEQAARAKQPPAPPLPVMVEQLKGQNALQLEQAKTQGELQQIAAEAAHEQHALQSGGMTPHMAQASAKIEQERIRATSAQVVEASRAHAEESRADKEMLIAQQNGQLKIEQLKLEREIAILKYSSDQKISLQTAQSQLAQSAMKERTRRELGAAEIELAASEGQKDRILDVHKHTTSLVRDELSIPGMP